jgi:spermidine synthase
MINPKRLIIWSIIGTGISSLSIQLLTIREFLTQFHGNEIAISLVLFVWLLINGLGSLTAKFIRPSSIQFYSLLILIIALWPLPQILFIRYFREAVFIHGASPGFYQIFFYILATTVLYCFLLGLILPYALKVLQANHYEFSSGELYITDNIGDILGGILFSFILVYWLKPFKIIAVTSALLILTAFFLQGGSRRYLLLWVSIILTSVFIFFTLDGDFEKSTLSEQYGNIVRYLESPFGRIIITREGPQHTFWESGLPIYSDTNVMKSEEKIHYPMSQLKAVENVLLISGGLGETLNEVSRYHPRHIDYVELDPYVTKAAQEVGILKKRNNLRIINSDARRFIRKSELLYDAVIIDLPEPDTFQLNRFFTKEFFFLVKKVLKKDGILSFGMDYSPNIISDIRKQKLSSLYCTAKMCFQNVRILPGGEAYFLCRDGEITTDIPARLDQKSISTKYIEGYYYGNVTPDRIKQIQESINREEFINTDFEPRIMNIFFKEWFLRHGTSPKGFVYIFLALIGIYLILMKKEEYILFSTGVAAMGVEMLLVFTFQVIYGYIYLKIGAIITIFLLGILPGAIVGNFYRDKDIARVILSEIIILFLLLLFFIWLRFIKGEPNQLVFLVYCFVFSFFCGFQFPVITSIIGEKASPAAGCLAADLAGAAVGTLLVGTLLIPFLGVQAAIIFLILVKVSSSMLLLFTKKRGY